METEKLEQEFLHPGEEFTPFPFWFWNDVLTEEEIERQLREFKEKGVDGFVIHPRIGLPGEIGYLTENYFYYVRHALKLAKQLHMRVMLYDEAMYPSGSCHGEVVKENPAFASRGLRMSNCPETEAGEKLTATLEKDGRNWYFIETFSHGTIRGLYEGEDDGEPGAPVSADLLNPEAVRSFLRHTHERYYGRLKEYFGDPVTAMFTDEPNILGRCARPGLIAWSGGLMEEFEAEGGTPEELYFLFASKTEQLQEKISEAEQIYRRVIYKRMSSSYYGQLAEWCRTHGIALTGHPEKSMDICYLQYFDIPCQDLVWRSVAPEEGKSLVGEDSTMAKCSSDSARHRGKRRNGNECFGCCSRPDHPYQLTKTDMKWYLDWLFVRGVNLIIPHAFYYSLRGKRREERPPEVGMHSGYWEEYRQITDYIKRMCWLLTDSVNQAETAILCSSQELSWQMAKPLYENQLEFNYLEEELLEKAVWEQDRLRIASQKYSVLLTDERVKKKTKQLLEKLEKEGLRVIRYREGMDLAAAVQEAAGKDISIQPECIRLRMTHVKKEGHSFFLLVNEGEESLSFHAAVRDGTVTEIWDAWSGKIIRLDGNYRLEENYRLGGTKTVSLSLMPGESRILVINSLKNEE